MWSSPMTATNNHLIGIKELHDCFYTHIRNVTDVRVDQDIILRAGAEVIRISLQGIRVIGLNIHLVHATDMVCSGWLPHNTIIHVGK